MRMCVCVWLGDGGGGIKCNVEFLMMWCGVPKVGPFEVSQRELTHALWKSYNKHNASLNYIWHFICLSDWIYSFIRENRLTHLSIFQLDWTAYTYTFPTRRSEYGMFWKVGVCKQSDTAVISCHMFRLMLHLKMFVLCLKFRVQGLFFYDINWALWVNIVFIQLSGFDNSFIQKSLLSCVDSNSAAGRSSLDYRQSVYEIDSARYTGACSYRKLTVGLVREWR